MRYDIDKLRKVVSESICMSDVCRLLNITLCTYNFRCISSLCEEHSISRSHFDIKRSFRRNKRTRTKADIFCEGSTYSRCNLRQAAMRFGMYTGCCQICGIGEIWMGKKLTLELDHINGINDDNREENLRWLCPNCHSQTDTYRNSNNRKISKE